MGGDQLRALADFLLNACALLLYICAAAIGAYALIAGAISALKIALYMYIYIGMPCFCGYLIWEACSVIIYIIPIVLGIAESVIMCAAEFLWRIFRGVVRIWRGILTTIV